MEHGNSKQRVSISKSPAYPMHGLTLPIYPKHATTTCTCICRVRAQDAIGRCQGPEILEAINTLHAASTSLGNGS